MDKRHISFSPVPDEAYISLRDHGFCVITPGNDALAKILNVGDVIGLQAHSGYKCAARLVSIQATGKRDSSVFHIYAPAI